MTRLPGLIGALAILCAACGSPSPERFEFTPAPYETIVWAEGSAAVGVDSETGGRYLADRLSIQVEQDRVQEFQQWAKTMRFDARVVIDNDSRGTTLLLVTVPVGSVPDAARFIAEQDGVVFVERDYVFEISSTPTRRHDR